MNNVTKLSDIQIGQKAFIHSIDTGGEMKRRLLDIGLIKGTAVECLFKSPLGDPTAFRVRSTVVAIRNKDCEKILVTM